MSRQFHLSDVLSVTTGRLMSNRGIEGIYEILNYMTGDDLYTHALPRAMRACTPALLEQHPQLAALKHDHVDPSNLKEWLADMVEKFGEALEVTPLAEFDHQDPIEELVGMVGNTGKEVMVVRLPEKEDDDVPAE